MSSHEIHLRDSRWLRNSFLLIALLVPPLLTLVLAESWWVWLLVLWLINLFAIHGLVWPKDNWRICRLENGGKLKLTDQHGFWMRSKVDGFWQLDRCVVLYGKTPICFSEKPWRLVFFYDNLSRDDFHCLMRFLKTKWVP